MSNSQLRHNKICENCGYTVDVAYCSECGQKNVETRQSFMHLAGHFMEDLTHYDSGFWKTIKYLLFRPAKLTKDYLEGKKITYTPPVKLYIFISFIAFLSLGLIPAGEDTDTDIVSHEAQLSQSVDLGNTKTSIKIKTSDTIRAVQAGQYKVKNIRELDSLRELPKDKRINWPQYITAKARLNSNNKEVSEEQVREIVVHTIPKVLFIYMPIFAFWLWLFHGKKRWYFFEHGIFTLHYFSFLLLFFTIILALCIIPGTYWGNTGTLIIFILWIIYLIYSFFYFFRAHRKMYGESRLVSRLKGFALFTINMISIVFVLCVWVVYILVNIH